MGLSIKTRCNPIMDINNSTSWKITTGRKGKAAGVMERAARGWGDVLMLNIGNAHSLIKRFVGVNIRRQQCVIIGDGVWMSMGWRYIIILSKYLLAFSSYVRIAVKTAKRS